MKVLQIINSLGAGGAENLVVDASILYNKKGVDVDVLLLNGENTPLYDRLESFEKIKIHTLKRDKVYSPFNVFEIRKIIRDYDIIHAHLFPVSYWVIFANMLNFKKKPIIFTEHNTTNRRRSIKVFKMIDHFIYKKFKKVVTISDAVDSSLKEHLKFKSHKRFIKIHNGIHLEKFMTAIPYSKKELGFLNSDQLIIQVSSFTKQKDQQTLIRAMELLPKEVKLILVGEGALIDEHIEFTKSKRLSDRVFFFRIRNDVPRLLKSVDIVVLSSHYEGLSLSCIEGMASGKPFIASDTPGLGSIVKGAGVLFEDESHKQLSEAILKLLNDSEAYALVVNKCIDKAKLFNIDLMVTSYINLYKSFYENKKYKA